MRRKIVAGNWKMNGSVALTDSILCELTSDIELMANIDSTIDVTVFPPYPYLALANQLLENCPIRVGAQNVAATEGGAFTGEVSASMLSDCHVGHVLVGHSERRSLYSESDAEILAKVKLALASGLTVTLCVGETLEQRQSGCAESIVTGQLDSVMANISVEKWTQLVVAYEPVWAIGTGETATPDQAQQMHAAIRQHLASVSSQVAAETRILYGGSMNAKNAAELLQQPDIDGGLVGGASLKAADFAEICRAAASISK